jgi:hypothetical protein
VRFGVISWIVCSDCLRERSTKLHEISRTNVESVRAALEAGADACSSAQHKYGTGSGSDRVEAATGRASNAPDPVAAAPVSVFDVKLQSWLDSLWTLDIGLDLGLIKELVLTFHHDS